MVKRILLAALCLAWLAPVAIAGAEEATIVLRSGERVTGQLIDHGAVGFTIVVNGQNRTIPTLDVVSAELAGSPEPNWNSDLLAKLNQGQHVIWLRNGQAVVGTFVDIGEGGYRFYVKTESGERSYTSNEIARIYLAPPRAVAATTGARPSAPGTIVVPATQQWAPTGIIVRKGETVFFKSSGEVQLSHDPNDKGGVSGAYNLRRAPAAAPTPDLPAGALIGRIGSNPPFAIGDQTSIQMPYSGELFLGVNDDGLSDNSGQFTVTIERRVDRRRRR